MVLILVYYPHHMDNFWTCFSKDHEKTKTSSCTFLSVLVHFNVIMPKLQDQPAQLGKALDVILQWCFNHNFSVRLYALLALKRVWSLAEARAAEGPHGFAGLSTVVKACLNQAEAMQSTGNANKNWVKIQEHFFFGCFHPIRDYSVETIFYTFPNLSDLADDEWIPPWKFENLVTFSENPSLPLRNPAPDLRDHQPGDWIQQDKGEQSKEDRWAEVQKKITPWKSGLQEQEAELQLGPQQRAVRLGKQHGALVVVASLIDKPTNLGGLCRTCEIFGASALVLDSLRHVSDKHFQSLSVSSELWLPLMEVKPVQLTDFLQAKKNEGYCIVGVEQTANSQSLQHYQFPEKTLLLLGNEREGIPANLLQMLDVCVEIPQQGIIRSLNVHIIGLPAQKPEPWRSSRGAAPLVHSQRRWLFSKHLSCCHLVTGSAVQPAGPSGALPRVKGIALIDHVLLCEHYEVSHWVVLLNSDINPLLYALLSKRFQGALQGLRQKIRACLRNNTGGVKVRAQGEDGKSGDPCTLTSADPRPAFSSEDSACDDTKSSSPISTVSTHYKLNPEEDLCTSHSGCIKNASQHTSMDHLRVPCWPQEGSRLPSSALTREHQATFFIGQITVRVEHNVC
ncbi:hypothetical protein fugu_012846 [Takifugu bimaculatus]|uniref:tRNA (guanosine(18)-2'-O)-methyltransferase TARBP1 n=1 Tax=Takifugu bimaculatus TaxID=433685 RepID=A0A4Z2C6L6_9TELE|nr:hypothetical protein fugu_012846 [Takifugu bimaculatus]